MSRIFAIVVVAAVLVGGIAVADVSQQNNTPADTADSETQQDLLSVFSSGYSVAHLVPFVLMAALGVVVLGVFKGQ